MTVAARVAEEAGTTLGQAVGYGIRFEDVTTPVSVFSPLAHYEESGATLQQGTFHCAWRSECSVPARA